MNTPNVDAGRLDGGLGGWAGRQCHGFMDFALFIHSAQYAEYRYCALPRFTLIIRSVDHIPVSALRPCLPPFSSGNKKYVARPGLWLKAQSGNSVCQ